MKLFVSTNKIFMKYDFHEDIEAIIKLLKKNKKYEDFENSPKYEISISAKNNLVLTVKNVHYYTTDEWYKNHKKWISGQIAGIAPYSKISETRKALIKGVLTRAKTDKPTNINDILEVSVRTRRLILTEDGRIYFMPKANCLRRLSMKKEKHIELLLDFINSFIGKSYNNCCDLFGKKKTSYENSKEIRKLFVFYLKKICKEISFINDDLFDNEDSYYNLTCYLQNYVKLEKTLLVAPNFFKKMIANDRHWCNLLYRFHSLKRNHFETIEVIKKLLTEDVDLKRSMKYFRYLKKAYANSNVNVEVIFVNRICDKKQMEVIDAIRLFNLYYTLKSKNKDKVFPEFKKGFHKMSLVEAHNYLSALVRECLAIADYNNYTYSDEVKTFTKEVNSYKFQLVRNSLELVEVAKIMSNCVAGYNQEIKSGRSIIVFAESKVEDYPNLCIELSPAVNEKDEEKKLFDLHDYSMFGYRGDAKRVVRQCYAPHNQHVRNENVIETLKSYFSSINYHWASIIDREGKNAWDDSDFI